MRNLYLLLLFWAPRLFAQEAHFSGIVTDRKTTLPVEGALVTLQPSNQVSFTDESGRFFFRQTTGDTAIQIRSIGHEPIMTKLNGLQSESASFVLVPTSIQLSNVTVTTGAGEQYRPISRVDIKLRGINNSQEVLRMVPGLFIGQHAGGGKAEQIFLRGFDIDHGTDISIGVDGMPVNMVSHAHGQGYADLHFLIPELIGNVRFKKGTYYAEQGNFNTSGFVDFKTFDVLPQNSIKVEGGMFNTLRTVGMSNLLDERARSKGHSAYVASEYMYTKGYFDAPQDFNRINVFGKYHGALDRHNTLSFSASAFSSGWDASGQIPDRAVADGTIGYFGAIDDTEGGKTSRYNANALLTTTRNNGAYFKNQLYYSRYHFTLFSNFTFFKEDPVNGDQIRQREDRDLFGYNGSYHKRAYWGSRELTTEVGAAVRIDATYDSELSRTRDRDIVTNAIKRGDVREQNWAAYISETLTLNSLFSLNAGLRYDYFHNKYIGKLQGDVRGTASAATVSPKLSVYFNPSDRTQFYLSSGRGFHSNDTRVVVPQNGLRILPPAYGSDFGTVLKPAKNLLVNAALWYLWLDQEFVYVGDEGIVEPSGKSRRYGADFSLRYQPLAWLYADVDVNYSHARAVGAPKGEDYLPLAPRLTSIGGLTVKSGNGINASLRYRYMGDRPATEDNSVVAKGYFVMDAFAGYQRNKYELGLTIKNLTNVKWKETQFDTESRLKAEAAPVSEIHFTPGTPFFASLSFTYFF
ncbi:TonB-dependent receptor [Pseudocnuella soli]|uniref:TonB-dependent receptor n=1 Tax=Pseudocnuella soli TaxID=2502779 RepID=UPI0010523973|nr:TonB-dependent receptor [Pseudocnuella soli]